MYMQYEHVYIHIFPKCARYFLIRENWAPNYRSNVGRGLALRTSVAVNF